MSTTNSSLDGLVQCAMDRLWQDIRYGARLMLRFPGVTARRPPRPRPGDRRQHHALQHRQRRLARTASLPAIGRAGPGVADRTAAAAVRVGILPAVCGLACPQSGVRRDGIVRPGRADPDRVRGPRAAGRARSVGLVLSNARSPADCRADTSSMTRIAPAAPRSSSSASSCGTADSVAAPRWSVRRSRSMARRTRSSASHPASTPRCGAPTRGCRWRAPSTRRPAAAISWSSSVV